MKRSSIKVAVCGATGYVGGELIRRLIMHPAIELVAATARRNIGQPLSNIFPHLLGLSTLSLSDESPESLVNRVDAVFFALPHKTTMEVIGSLFDEKDQYKGTAAIIDMSGDFRLNDPQRYAEFYSKDHSHPSLLKHFVYGLSEWKKSALSTARFVANPGCFATAINLALAPLAVEGKLPKKVTVFAATGSSGSGASPIQGTHHPERFTNFKLYKVLNHQHTPEIESLLSQLGSPLTKVSFIPASAPMARGIFAVAHIPTSDPNALADIVINSYSDSHFVRVRSDSPQLNWVTGSNFADISVFAGTGELIVACAIDNMVKGAAGQAIQNFNLMFGLSETVGLLHEAPSLP